MRGLWKLLEFVSSYARNCGTWIGLGMRGLWDAVSRFSQVVTWLSSSLSRLRVRKWGSMGERRSREFFGLLVVLKAGKLSASGKISLHLTEIDKVGKMTEQREGEG